jgi:large subunit ribosomal protein L17
MRKRNSVNKLGRKSSHRQSLMRNQLGTLINSGKLVTTSVKAKIVRGEFESMVDDIRSTEDKLQLRRNLLSNLGDVKVMEKVIKYVTGADSKVKILKVGFRKGDNAEISEVILTEYEKVFVKKVAKKTVAKDVKETKVVEEGEKGEESTRANKGPQDNIAQKITKSLTQTFTGRKERSRSRSGL